MEKYPIVSSYRLDYYKGYINVVVYYNHKTFRYSLAKIPEDSFLVKTKMLKETSSLPNAKKMAEGINEKIELFERAYKLLQKDENKKDTLYKRDIEDKIVELRIAGKVTTKVNAGSSVVNDSIVDDFKRWLEGKGKKQNRATRKDFISAYDLLQDFEYDKGHRIKYDDIDDDLIEDIIAYCYEPRVSTEEHKYLTQGGLSNKTINKRLDCIYQFIRGYYRVFPEGLKEKHKLEVYPKKIIRLDVDEIKQLMQLEVDEPSLKYARDCLVFLCLTGLRYGDFAKLNRNYVQGNYIVLNTNKTKKECRIYLSDDARRIGEQYNYMFAPPCNQVLNKQIHSLLEKYDLFPEEETSIYLAKEEVVVKKPKRDFITCHTGRRTFISMLAEGGLDLTDIMSMSGHTSVRMVQVYIDLFGKRREEKFEKFFKNNFDSYETKN